MYSKNIHIMSCQSLMMRSYSFVVKILYFENSNGESERFQDFYYFNTSGKHSRTDKEK